jgi:hypothetical protein
MSINPASEDKNPLSARLSLVCDVADVLVNIVAIGTVSTVVLFGDGALNFSGPPLDRSNVLRLNEKADDDKEPQQSTGDNLRSK